MTFCGNKILTISMSHPTSFFILDNEELGTCWIGQTKMRLDTNGRSLLPHISREQLIDKLATKYEEYSYPCLEVERVKKDGTYLFYGLEQWLTKLKCEIKRNPRKLRDVNELLTAGWIEGDPMINSTVHVLHINNTKEVVQNVYRKLLGEWEAKGFRCLNKLRCKTYEDKKRDPNFMYNKARKEVLRQMKKTGKMPKQSTVEKYELKNSEIKEVMEEVVLCQPCEKEFYKKGRTWYCLCDKRIVTCSNLECKEEGVKLGLKVGGSICEHDRYRSTCKKCGGGGICEHNIQRPHCKECGGSQICEHNKNRSGCKKCGGTSICEHNIRRQACKQCGGTSICEHNRQRSMCKECGGSQICEHNKNRSGCKKCGGTSICEHNRQRSQCKECGGSQICEHDRIRSQCKQCGGSQICEHNRRRSMCKDCGGGHICEHNRQRSICRECGGGSICEHNKQRSKCKICNPQSYIKELRRYRRWNAINSPNSTHTLDDLCMTSAEWLKYLHKTFEDRYGRPKTEKDEVHIDEIIPCSAWNLPDDNKYCWHYLNSQWLLAEDNLSKSDSYQEEEKLVMIERIQSSTYTSSSEIG